MKIEATESSQEVELQLESTEQTGKLSSITSFTVQRMMEQEQKRADQLLQKQELAKRNFAGKGGRPKGSKNKLTLLREAVLAKAEDMVLNDWEEVVQTTLTLAKAGDTQCLKILWDRVIPSKRAIDDRTSGVDKTKVIINISGLEVKSVLDEDLVEAEFEEVKDD